MRPTQNKRPELLSPARDFESVRAAFYYGADAVYIGGSSFHMRAASANFSLEALRQAVDYAHARERRLYVACNAVVHNEALPALPSFLEQVQEAGADALIISDLGVLRSARRYAPRCPIHISVQAGVTNYETACFFAQLGVKRIVLSRELTLAEIAQIRANAPDALELEAFVHGAMCVSSSARCLLSHYMAGRDANQGDCAQPCRWQYTLHEQKRPGAWYDITQDEGGTYLLNAKDLCMAAHIPQLLEAGIDCFKLEGRVKSAYYVGAVTNAYRAAVDSFYERPGGWTLPAWIEDELQKVSHRPYSTGFYFGPSDEMQAESTPAYLQTHRLVGVVERWEDGVAFVRQKNKFSVGQTLDCMQRGKPSITVPVSELFDADGKRLESASHPEQLLRIPCGTPLHEGAFLRAAL